jgi:hypothetical protein
LSFDKRGVGDSGGPAGDNGVEQVAAAAFRFLKQQPGVDPARIGIWGMSEGGIVAPKVATFENGVRFIVNESGSIVDANTEEIERTANMMPVDGFSERDIADAVAFQRLKFHYARLGQGWNEYAAAYKNMQAGVGSRIRTSVRRHRKAPVPGSFGASRALLSRPTFGGVFRDRFCCSSRSAIPSIPMRTSPYSPRRWLWQETRTIRSGSFPAPITACTWRGREAGAKIVCSRT